MPKGAKPAPPQQTSLAELWTGKAKASAKPKKIEEPQDKMDVEETAAKQGGYTALLVPRYLIAPVGANLQANTDDAQLAPDGASVPYSA
jgi:hypothetical protein